MNKTAVFGGTKKFYEFLELTGADITVVSAQREAIEDYDFDSFIMLPEYEKGEESVPQLCLEEIELLAKRKREGFRVYSENYNSYNTYNKSVFSCEIIGKICHINNESLCAFNGFQNIFGDGRLLQASVAAYLPAVARFTDPYILEKGVLLKKGPYVGTSQISPSVVTDAFEVLIQTGSFFVSLISITNLDYVNFRPNSRWKKIYIYIFSRVLGIDEEKIAHAFDLCYPSLRTAMSLDSKIPDSDKEKAYTNALLKAVQWHIDSGIVLGDGKTGCVEMIMSSNGQQLYENRRTDSGFYTGWLLYAAGKYFNNDEWIEKGKNIFDFFAAHTQLEGGTLDGLFTWYYNTNAGPHDIYTIDCGRNGIAMCNMYKLTGDKSLLDRIRRLADGFSNWMHNGLISNFCARHEDTPTNEAHPGGNGVCAPGLYGEMVSFMVMASEFLGERKYLDRVIETADKLVKRYPDYDYHGHTTSARNARLLMILLCIQHTGERDYSELINVLIDYLAGIQLPCGGIYCEDNITFEKNIESNNESGIVAPWENDKISDQLYVINNALASLSILKKFPDDSVINKEKGVAVFEKLVEFVTKIQIDSDDKRFNGGWMRAYSMTHQEYYGIDLDRFWGAYCIMAGWTMGIIPLAILTKLTGECPYIV